MRKPRSQKQTDTNIRLACYKRPFRCIERLYCAANLPVPVLGLDEVGKGLGLNVRGVVVTVVVVVVVYDGVRIREGHRWLIAHTGVVSLGTDVVQLNDVTALVATLNGALTGDLTDWLVLDFVFCRGTSYGQPVNLVGVDGVTSATSVLLITGTVNHDGVVDRSYDIHD